MKKRISVPFLAAAIVVLALLAVIVIAKPFPQKSIGGIPGKAVGAPLHRGAGIHRRRGKD